MADALSPPSSDDLQRELTTTHHLLGELGVCSSEENGKVLDLLGELKEMTQKKDLELRRYFRKYFKKKIAPWPVWLSWSTVLYTRRFWVGAHLGCTPINVLSHISVSLKSISISSVRSKRRGETGQCRLFG